MTREPIRIDGIDGLKAFIKGERLRRGWTQLELAARIGATQSAISDFERGRNVPTMPTLLRLLDAFNAHLYAHPAADK